MSRKPLILICDDNSDLLRSLQLSLRNQFEVHTSSTVMAAKALAGKHDYDAAVIDLNFEGQEHDGVDLVGHMNQESPGTFLLILSGDPSTKRVVQAHRQRHFAFIYKDKDFFEPLLLALNRAVQLKEAREKRSPGKYLTRSPAVKHVLEMADRILRANTDSAILILGETGTGKEFLAQHIAAQMGKPLVAANMASIPKDTAESVLFGHERGAFTGAVTNKVGLIETANGGIFFLDEIGESSSAVQAKLLRVLQEKEVQPLGSTRTRKVQVRFIAATHRNLDTMVGDGAFRLDLLQRLNTFVLRLPTLKERPEDILLYTELFLEEAAEDQAGFSITPDGVQALLSYSWPGNIRELKSVIQRIVILSPRRVVDEKAVHDALCMGREESPEITGRVAALSANLKRDELLRALEESKGNKRMAAQKLKISEATIYRWIQEFGLASFKSSGIPHGKDLQQEATS